MSKPRLLHVTATDYAAYYTLLPWLEGLLPFYDLTVACAPGPDLDGVAARGIRVVPVPVARSLGPGMVAAVRELAGIMRAGRFDLVHTHTPSASLAARPAARLAGLRRLVYTAHGFYFHDRMPALQYRAHVLLERMLGRLTSHLVTVSAEDASVAVAERIMPADRVTWIPNGLDLDRFQPPSPERAAALRAELGLAPGQPAVGMVGRLVREKGFFDFVEAARLVAGRVPEARFVCVGDALPSDRENPMAALKQMARDLGVADRVIFTGWRKDAVEIVGLLDLFALPSYREGLPISIMEAMAMARPCVVSNIRGCRELVRNGQEGRLVEPGDPAGLAEAVSDLLVRPDLARQMGEAGRRRIEAEFTLSRQVERYRNLYQTLL